MSLVAELDRTRKIGVEYECAIPIIGSGDGRSVQECIANILSENGIRACWRTYSHAPLEQGYDIAVESDSSITGEQGFRGVRWAQVEVKTRILDGIEDWERVVPRTLEIVRYCGGRITPSCGHHLHLSFDEVKRNVRHVRSFRHRRPVRKPTPNRLSNPLAGLRRVNQLGQLDQWPRLQSPIRRHPRAAKLITACGRLRRP